jgi:hypothetical protein
VAPMYMINLQLTLIMGSRRKKVYVHVVLDMLAENNVGFQVKCLLLLFYFTQKNYIPPYCSRNINCMKIFILISQTRRLGEGNRRHFQFSLHPVNTQISLNLTYVRIPFVPRNKQIPSRL